MTSEEGLNRLNMLVKKRKHERKYEDRILVVTSCYKIDNEHLFSTFTMIRGDRKQKSVVLQ